MRSGIKYMYGGYIIMDQRKTKAFFEGRDIHAYNIFGAHLEGDGVRFQYMLQTQNISVIGTFNNWDDQASKMKKINVVFGNALCKVQRSRILINIVYGRQMVNW